MFLNKGDIQRKALIQIQKDILQYSFNPKNTQIMAVTKTFSASAINSAIDNGVTIIGENKTQETKQKIQKVQKKQNTEIHFIGKLQSNKVKDAVKLYDVIQTVDREKIAYKINISAEKQNKIQKIMIQVNISQNKQQGGIEKEKLLNLCDKIKQYNNIKLIGIMAIATNTKKKAKIQKEYKNLNELFNLINTKTKHNITEISAGMSKDYIDALQNNATIIRIGSKLFGNRE